MSLTPNQNAQPSKGEIQELPHHFIRFGAFYGLTILLAFVLMISIGWELGKVPIEDVSSMVYGSSFVSGIFIGVIGWNRDKYLSSGPLKVIKWHITTIIVLGMIWGFFSILSTGGFSLNGPAVVLFSLQLILILAETMLLAGVTIGNLIYFQSRER